MLLQVQTTANTFLCKYFNVILTFGRHELDWRSEVDYIQTSCSISLIRVMSRYDGSVQHDAILSRQIGLLPVLVNNRKECMEMIPRLMCHTMMRRLIKKLVRQLVIIGEHQ